MKIMMILNGFCHWDATGEVGSLEAASERYAPDMVFVETPDWVFEGFGYNPDLAGDARFIRPVPPKGWLYDDATGTIYMEGSVPKSAEKSCAELTAENAALQDTITELELALCEMYEALIVVTGG